MYLKKAKLAKVPDADNVARELVHVDVKMGQVEAKELTRQAACQLIKVNVKKIQVGQRPNFGRNLATQASSFEPQACELVKESDLRWERTWKQWQRSR